MKKLDLWRRRGNAAASPHDVLPTEAAVAEAHEHADSVLHAGHDAGREEQEDTVPAAFYRSAG